jgi:predicted permease
MARSLGQLHAVDLGFDARGLITTEVSMGNVQDWRRRRTALIDEMLTRVGALPFVSGVSTLDYVPIAGSAWNDTLRVDGGGHPETASQLNRVGDTYFNVMGTPLLEGRVFTPQDVPGGVDVAVVNRAVRDTMFGGHSPIGASVRILSEPGRTYQIVGVVGDTKYGTLRETRQPVLFVSTRQQADAGAGFALVIRSRLPAASTVPLIRRALLEIEPAVSLRTRALEETIESTLVVERLLTRLSLFFGGLALLLAGVGLYGVIAYDAARRQRDIGIRLALGSTRRAVVLTVVGQVGWLLGAGLLMGCAVSVPLARWVEGLLYGVTVRDLGTYALAAAALMVVGFAAAWVPAWRASRLNPTSALRAT